LISCTLSPRRPRHRADMPEHIKAHLRGDKLVALRVAKRKKKPFPKMLSSQPKGKTKMDDET